MRNITKQEIEKALANDAWDLGNKVQKGNCRVCHRRNPTKLVSKLFVSVSHTECDVTSNKPSDLRLMGKVAQQEYECFAVFAEMFGRLPEFNDKYKSPKK